MARNGCTERKINRRKVIPIVIIVLAVSGTVAAAYALHLFGTNTVPGNVQFTVVMTQQGFNGSRNHVTDPWPVMNVAKGQRITIHLWNNDTTVQETHGFAITHYFDGGVALRPGETYDLTFTANQSGSFLVYCNILCVGVHAYMQNGRLNVA